MVQYTSHACMTPHSASDLHVRTRTNEVIAATIRTDARVAFLFRQVAAILCVVSYWQELQDDLFGKEKRVKYHRKLANIRTAALSGVNTPYKSYYSSRSMLQLNQSQMSLSNA